MKANVISMKFSILILVLFDDFGAPMVYTVVAG